MLNFLKINPKINFNFENTGNNVLRNTQASNKVTFNAVNLAPLKQDTITFSGRCLSVNKGSDTKDCYKSDTAIQTRDSKTLERKSDMGSWKVANQILNEEDIEFAFERFKTDISSIFGMPVIDFTDKKLKEKHKEEYVTMLAENINKSNPILAITARKKEAASIKEKMGSKHLRTKKEAKKQLTDILGVRIILSGTNKDSGNYVVKKLTKAVEQGKIKITEIENYRNPEFKYPARYQYASDSKLEELMRASLKRGVKTFNYDIKQTESGYTALHMLLEFPGGIKGELQIAGLDVLRLKEVEDLCFKALTNKSISHEHNYKKISDLFIPIKDDNEKYCAFMDYTRRAYAAERAKETHPLDKDLSFLELPDDSILDPVYDFNAIEKMKDDIDKAELAKIKKQYHILQATIKATEIFLEYSLYL